MDHSSTVGKVLVAAASLAGFTATVGCSSAEGNLHKESSGLTVSKLSPDVRYARVGIGRLGAGEREVLKNRPGIQRWIEVDRQLLVLANSNVIEGLKTEYSVLTLEVTPRPESLCLVHQRHDRPDALPGGTVLARASNLIVLQADGPDCADLMQSAASSRVRPLMGNEVVARQLVGDATKTVTQPNPHTNDVIDALDMNRWQQDVATLASFDRYALRAANIGQAKEWIVGEFCAILGATPATEAPANSPGIRCQNANMEVRTEPFVLGTVESRNVILTLNGFRSDGPVFVVGAHYDATAPGAQQAPGAEDNASGAAAVIEMARAIAQYPTDATFVFVAFSGEEQGMRGSQNYVQQLAGTALANRIRSVVIMDMIGYSGDSELDCMLETADTPQNQELLEHLANMANIYAPELVLSSSTNYWGSDHEPFLDAGYSGLLTIENDYETYPFYHSVNDTFANQNARFQSMASLIVRMNTAALAEWSVPNAFYAALTCITQD